MGSKLNQVPNECSCEKCQQMCKRPCWGTPEDMQRIIDAGYGHRLMRDFWGASKDEENEYTFILSPALKGHEGEKAPFYPRSPEGCTFWKDGLCELHDLGLKPIEGKLATCKPEVMPREDEISLHEEIYLTWKNPEAQKFSDYWTDQYIDLENDGDPLLKILELLQGMHDCLRDKNESRQSD